MSQLNLYLLGPPRIELDGVPISVDRHKATALLVYATLVEQIHSRDSLATRFWPAYDQRSARANLRRTLYVLKKALNGRWLEISRESVVVNRGDDLWSDVDQFQSLLRSYETHGHLEHEVCPECLSDLRAAVTLYVGDFLAGFTLQDSPDFDEWQLLQAEQLRQQFATALERLVNGYTGMGEFKGAISYARRWLAVDPLNEHAHRQLMRLLAWSGEHAAALHQYRECERLLAQELGLPPDEATTSLHEAIRTRQLPPPQVPISKGVTATSLGPRTHNLPQELTPFVGREKELAEVRELLLDEPLCRLLTLVGMGGIGKTRLALEAAANVLAAFSDGVCFVSLASVSRVEFIAQALCDALDINLQRASDPKARLLSYLRHRQVLMLVDNFEQLLEGAPLLGEIAVEAPQVKLLVTSRERLNLKEEWVYELQGLPFPAAGDVTPGQALAFLEDYDAVRLFVQSARRADATFSASAEDIKAIARLCQLVDGMPLALELAAPWVRSMTCQEIVNEVEQSLDILSTRLRNVPQRHRSMRATFEKTWSRLPPAEQVTLGKLSVFHGGCSRAAAEQVTGASLLGLSSLVEKALLRRRPDGRYDMHEVIRLYAIEQLRAQLNAYEETLDRHSDYYTAFLQQRSSDVYRRRYTKVENEISAEIGNVRAAWDRAISQRDVGGLERSAEALYAYYNARSSNIEGEATFRRAVSAFIGETDVSAAIDFQQLPKEHKPLVGFLLAAQGDLMLLTGRLKEGQSIIEQGIALQRQADHRNFRHEAHSLISLAFALHWQGDYLKAEAAAQESLALSTELNEPLIMAWALNRLGSSALQRGRPVEASRFLHESKLISDKTGDRNVGAVTRQILGMTAIDFGDYDRADEFLEEALIMGQAIDSKVSLAGTERERSRLALALGNFQEALDSIGDSLALLHELEFPWEEEVTLRFLASIHRQQGDYEEAQLLYERSLAAARSVGHNRLTALCLSGLGCVAFDRGLLGPAEQYQLEALSLYEKLANEAELASVVRYLGHINVEAGESRQSDAIRYYWQAFKLAKRHRLAPVALDVCRGVAGLLGRVGKKQEAVELLIMAKQHASSTYETREKAGKYLDELTVDLPMGVDADEQTERRMLDLWETTAKYMEELPKMG